MPVTTVVARSPHQHVCRHPKAAAAAAAGLRQRQDVPAFRTLPVQQPGSYIACIFVASIADVNHAAVVCCAVLWLLQGVLRASTPPVAARPALTAQWALTGAYKSQVLAAHKVLACVHFSASVQGE